MRVWPRRASVGLLALLLAGCGDGTPGLRIVDMELHKSQNIPYISLRLAYDFNEEILDALHNGVPLTLAIESRVQRARRWRWPHTLVHRRLEFTLSYHTLSGQYLVRRPQSSAPRSFPNLEAALASMRIIEHWALSEQPLEAAELRYGVRVGLALDKLPAPLQLVAYVSPAWQIGSGWVEASVTP